MLRIGRDTARTTLAHAHRRHFHPTSTSHAVLGLVAGNGSRAGSGKPAIVPADVTTLIRDGHKVLVDKKLASLIPGEYEAAGAHVKAQVDSRDCDVVASIAAPSIEEIEPLKRYPNGMQEKPTVFVSYFRLQEQCDENLRSAMLASAADRGSRFIETSKLPGEFVVSGGPIKACLAPAIGTAAMRNGLSILKEISHIRGMQGRVDTLGHSADTVIRKIKKGKSIIIAIAGDTGAARGAQAALSERFKVQWIKASELPARSAIMSHSPQVYACLLEPEDYLVGPDGSFDPVLYGLRPDLFTSHFHTKIAPYVTLFCNAAYARSGSPSLLPPAAAASLMFHNGDHLFLAVDAEKGLSADLARLSQLSIGGTPMLAAAAGNVSDKLYWNRSTGQQRTFTLRDLADFLPLDVLEQHSRMLRPHVHLLLDVADSSSAGSSSAAREQKSNLRAKPAQKAKKTRALRALAHAELDCKRA